MAEEKDKQLQDNHGHHCCSEAEPLNVDKLDAGSKALANALKMSFMLLKVIMVVMVLSFFVSGFFTVEQGYQAMVLRLGKITGQGQERIRKPGWGWCWPAPIDEVVKFPVKLQQTLKIDKDFWYFGEANSRFDRTLKPERDGYCITRNDAVGGVEGNDYNIVHTKWEIKYHIGDIELFFRNIYLEKMRPGQDFYDIKSATLEPYLTIFASDAIVNTLVKYSIDDALTVGKTDIANDIKKILVDKLQAVDSGLVIDSVLLVGDVKWPRQVEDAFLASTKAAQDAAKEVISAEKYYDSILNETGGRYAVDIVKSLKDDSFAGEQSEALWAKVAGTAKQKITAAQTYRTAVVESARANAVYLQTLLPEYRKRPELVLKQIYQDAIEEILNNADEKIFIQPQMGDKGREIRLIISRDPNKKLD